MKKLAYLIIVIFCLGVSGKTVAQCIDKPIINDFSPKTGFIGSTVTITGANFSATPTQNQVFFGATQATVVSSSFGTIEVRVPEGSTTALISVKNQCNLSAYSKTHFNGVFCPTPLTATSYQNTAQELAGIRGAYNMLSQDMDNDGKPEVISATSNGITIAKNNSTPSNINFTANNFSGQFNSLTTADFDGDGFKDIASNGGVFRNTSAGAGNIGLVYVTDSKSVSNYQIGSGDFNNDGKIDIIGEFGGSVWVAFNTSTGPGNINFSARQLVASGIGRCTGIQVADVDGDGKADFLASQGQSNRATSIRNITSNGSTTASFETPEYWASDANPADGFGTFPYRAMIADFDKDGKIDFTSCNYQGNTNTAIWRNISTVGNISFATVVNIDSPAANYRIGVGDVDGDGYPDIVTKSLGINVFSVYRNTTSTAGTPSFAPRFDYTSSNRAEVSGIVIGDLDGDFVPDIATSGISSNTIRFHRNTGGQNDVTPPTVSCKNITVALSPAGTITITPEMIDNGSGDACGIESLVLSQVDFTCADIGENTVTLTATDGAGNQATCTATVNVQPAAIIVAGQSTVCQGETVELNANNGDSYQWKKDGIDLFGAIFQNYVATTSGNYTVVVTNNGGCSGESLPTPVVVNDNPTVDISPSGTAVLCPPNNSTTLTATQSSIYQWIKDGVDIPDATQQTYEATSAGNYSVRVIDLFGCSAISEPTTVSANSAEIEISNNGTNVANGATTVVDGFNLDYGNVLPNNSYDTLITIDNTSSTANNAILDVDIAISGPDAQYLSIVGLTSPVAISPGTQANFTLVFNGPDLRAYNAIVTILSNDCNESSTSINVTAEITCEAASFTSIPENITANNDEDVCGALIDYEVITAGNPTPELTYSFSGATSGNGNGSGTGMLFNVGTTTVTLNLQNACGNETETFDVTVADNQSPNIVLNNITVVLDANGNASITPEMIDNGSSDNCAIDTITISPNLFTCANYGENTVTLTVTDINGNSNTGTAIVTVDDGTMQTSFNQADYINIGNSNYLGNDEYRLTSAVGGQFGAVWYQNKLNLSTDFELDFDVYLGNNDGGADGMAFVLQPLSTNQGSSGGGLGYLGISPSLAVEFDTYSNTSDPGQDHVALMKNGDVNHFSSNNLSGPHVVSNLENGAYHNVKISWIKATNNFTVVFNGNTIINYNSDIVNDIFSGNNGVFWGFTAATGYFNNEHKVKINTVTFKEELNVSANSITAASCPDSSDGAIDINISSANPCTTYSWSNGATTQDITGLNPGDYTVTITNADGTSISETYTVTGDVTSPQFLTTETAIIFLDENGVATYDTNSFNVNTVTDNCAIDRFEFDKTVYNCNEVGFHTINVTAFDTSGNSTIGTINLEVRDEIAPLVQGQDISVTLTANGTVSIVANDVLVSGSDNCGPVTYTISQNTFTATDAINSPVTVQLTATDANGNTTTVPVLVTVIDPVPVVITQDIIVELDANGNVTITPNQIDNGSNSVVGIANLELDNTSFNCSNIGVPVTVTLTATSTLGRTATGTATVTVLDTTAPNVITQNIVVQLDENGNASITPEMINNGSSDNCGIEDISLDITNFSCNNIGNNQVILTVKDINGNLSNSTANVVVEDTISPTIAIQNITVPLNENGIANFTVDMINNGTTDNCAIASLELSETTFACSNLGENTVTFTATDVNGNVSTENVIVTVIDEIAPTVITKNIEVYLDASGNASITPEMVDNGSYDNCTFSLSLDTTTFSCNNTGDNIVSLIAIDASGLQTTQQTTVTVIDSILPTAVSQDVTVQLDENGNASITPEMINNGSSDNCTFTTSLDVLDFTCTNVGENLVTLTVRDASGNTTTSSSTVTVIDSVPAEVITQNINVYLDENGNTSIVVEDINNGSNDACGIETLTLDVTNFSCDTLGENTVTLTATDVNGNISSNTAIVTVIDNIAPTVGTQNISVELDANGNATITPQDVLITSESDIETGEECDVTDAKYHAMYLNGYVKNYNQHKTVASSKKKEIDFSSKGDASRHWGARYIFDADGGKITKNLDGTASVVGTLVNKYDSNDKWIVTLNLKNASNWTEWSAMGRSWKGNPWSVRGEYKNWMYYEMAEGSNLTGAGNNTGTVTNIYHAPTSLKYGVQLGNKANLQDSNFGLSGWFYYKNRYNCWEQGDFNFNVSNCSDLAIPEETVITSDNCSISSYTLSQDSFGCDDLGENTIQVSVTDQSGNTTTKDVIVNVLGDKPTVTIDDFYAVKYQKKNTIFLGYAESIYLCPTVTGGTGFTYEWTDDSGNVISTEKLPKVSPKFTTTYTVTVTNSNGCTATDSIEVCVIDARSTKSNGHNYRGNSHHHGHNNDKVIICHHTRKHGQIKHKEISVSKNSVRAHLWHGDKLGSCNATCISEGDVVVTPNVEVSLYPNPSSGVFNVKVENLEKDATVYLYNIYGRIIQKRYIRARSGENKVVMGSYRLKQGAYVVKVITDGTVYTQTILIERSRY
ncbi:VCBS repeat-containing protein [Polaribacter pectinis]|uniref:VCBS repeat-containing protein n=1 Tax=Polaribacter pectinis TaxID=2738844 RepID=A0A7G9LDW3_9FLAO|nr:FG-GAP-like repeat-containing protein [Polaribacter pectinis]QNM86812.1 VCBS repeat-containing protein [Polaribacter pectinis]